MSSQNECAHWCASTIRFLQRCKISKKGTVPAEARPDLLIRKVCLAQVSKTASAQQCAHMLSRQLSQSQLKMHKHVTLENTIFIEIPNENQYCLFNALLVLSGHKDQQAATRAHERSHGTHKGIGAVLSGHKGTRAVTRHSQEHTSAHTALTRAYERSHGTPWKSLLSSNGPVPPFARARV